MKKGQKKGESLDLIGSKYGKLTVVSLEGRGARNRYIWSCVCECGGIKAVAQDLLTCGKTKSCGCLIGPSRLAHNKYPDRVGALFNLLYFSVKKRHNKKSKEKCIGIDLFINLSNSPCNYCGTTGSNTKKDVRRDSRGGEAVTAIVSDTTIKFNGIDRIDSSKGYTEENCVSCCKECNTAKMSLTENEFRSLIIKIYEHWAK